MIWGMFGDNMMVTENNRSQWLIIGIITLAVMILAGGHFYRNAWKSLIHRTATMDTLIALGTGAALLYSISVNLWPQAFPTEARHIYYEASTMIIGLINLGHMLEARARARSSTALSHLLDLTPPTARLVTPEGDKTLPLEEVQPGMVLCLTTGDHVPVDGEIIQGEAWLDEAMLTGEPLSQQKSSGETLHAGTVVQDGSVLFTASRTGNHTTLARIIHLVRQAQSSKPEVGKLADRISAVFVPVVVAIALISGAIWYCVGAGDADVDYRRDRTRCRVKCTGAMPMPFSAPENWIRWYLIKPGDLLKVVSASCRYTRQRALANQRHCGWRQCWSKAPAIR